MQNSWCQGEPVSKPGGISDMLRRHLETLRHAEAMEISTLPQYHQGKKKHSLLFRTFRNPSLASHIMITPQCRNICLVFHMSSSACASSLRSHGLTSIEAGLGWIGSGVSLHAVGPQVSQMEQTLEARSCWGFPGISGRFLGPEF